MNGLDFFTTAKQLAKSDKESDLRSSIGRSYYSILHYLCEYIAKVADFKKEKVGTQIHKFVPECFNVCQNKEAKLIAMQFNKLKQKRTDADYKLNKTINQSISDDCIRLAQKIINIDLNNFTEEIYQEAHKRATVNRWF